MSAAGFFMCVKLHMIIVGMPIQREALLIYARGVRHLNIRTMPTREHQLREPILIKYWFACFTDRTVRSSYAAGGGSEGSYGYGMSENVSALFFWK